MDTMGHARVRKLKTADLEINGRADSETKIRKLKTEDSETKGNGDSETVIRKLKCGFGN